jgi:hypothetical protein
MKLGINKYTAEQIAADLKEMQLELLRKYNTECLNTNVPSDDATHKNINKLWNDISIMVISDVLSANSKKELMEKYKFYINVAKESGKLHDYASAHALVTGLKNFTLERLLTLEKKDTKNMTLLGEYQNLKTLDISYTGDIEKKILFVPYMGSITARMAALDGSGGS